MEAKLRGMGWGLLIWGLAFIALCFLLAGLSCLPEAPAAPESGAICMTTEMLNKALDAACTEGYANGYQKAKAEVLPRADVELKLFTYAGLIEFLKLDQSDRCSSSVPGEDASQACLDRAQSLTQAARDAGYDAWGVVLNFEDLGSHAIVAFPLKDRVVYIEPWFDLPVTIEVGKPYMNTNRIIKKIGILW